MSEQGEAAVQRLTVMGDERSNQAEKWWKDVAEVLIPRLGDLDGTKTMDSLLAPATYDSQGRTSLEIAGNAIFSLMCGPNVDWISLGMFNNEEVMRDKASREYFDRLRICLLDTLYDDGFYENIKPASEYAMSLGTVATTVTKEENSEHINYILWHPGDSYIRKGGDRRVREAAFRQKVRNKDLLSYPDLTPERLEIIRKDPNAEVDLLYYIGKSADDGEENLVDLGMPYYIMHLLEDGEVLQESGLHSLPGSFWTFEADPRMDYGLSPGYHVLRDLLQNNKLRRLLLQETEKRINPAIWAPEQGSSQLYTDPGSINYYNGQQDQFPRRLHDVADVNLAFQMKEEINNIIRTRFYTDFFLAVMSKTHRRTAQEIAATQNEVGSQIAPLVYTVERNFIGPQIKRTLMLLNEMGKLPEPSAKIQANMSNFPLEVAYIGPLSMSQRYLYHTVKNTQLLNDVLVPAAQLDPASLDNINIDRLVRESALGLNGAYGVLNDEAEVEQIRAQRAAMMQQQQENASRQEALGMSKSPEGGSPAEAAMNA